jgi:hypothetical protein
LRDLALSDRKRDLDRLCRKSKVPYLRQVETFPDGAVRFDYCSKFGFEGVVSNRKGSRYSSGPKPQLGQDDVPGLERINSERCRLFEGPRKPELTEARKTLAKKREGLARVLERLRSPQLIPGMARELRKHVAILAREIAELTKQGPT